ncbi:Bromodomain and PHD finger-containing protein 3 [Babesia sp. Xinjiang]|uniref:Bromodomain and PHD finger-containing protein 3 n=1 Tax=Babesia sp. Xinjiang TaxID=462227 RepID=UPI000A21B0CE|nr:Bromodomain and PHD finger-containing protein 3 [Babesia sp. Xinjiang]ORM40152.1 Bromodomain and PHD finger-containing protein 3 [Babesia sp. Xinjiang]
MTIQMNVSAQQPVELADSGSAESSLTAGRNNVPTDYISALEQYGSLSCASDMSRCDNNARSAYGNNSAINESWGLTHSNYEGTLYAAFEPSLCSVESDVLGRCGILCNPEEPVSVPPNRRCDACLGPVDCYGWNCIGCGIIVHDLCYISREEQMKLLEKLKYGRCNIHSTDHRENYGDMSNYNEVSPKNAQKDHNNALLDEFKFTCDVCSAQGTKGNPKCALCGLSGGAMRYSRKEDLWVHCSCVVFAPPGSGVFFKAPFRMRNPCGMRAIATRTVNPTSTKCDACGSAKGLLVMCSFVRCSRKLHVRCALFLEGYNGTAFSDHVYYKTDERPQYSTFLGVFCAEHSTQDWVAIGIRMHLSRCHVIRESNASSYRKYHNEVADMVRMTSAVTTAAMREDCGEAGAHSMSELSMKVEPCVSLPTQIDRHVSIDSNEGDHGYTQNSLDEWKEYFMEPRDERMNSGSIVAIQRLKSDEIDIDLPIRATVPSDVLPVVEMHPGHGDGNVDGGGSQFRGQRMIWQKFDIFRPILYGPAADLLLKNMDAASQKKSADECPSLESTVLACSDFLDPQDLSDMFLQQILYGCTGVMSFLAALKTNLDREVQSSLKANSSPVNNDRKHARFHVLVDTGRTAGIAIFRVNKWLLEVLNDDAILSERCEKPALSAAGMALDEEVRHFLSHVNSEMSKSTSAAHAFLSPNANGNKEVTLLSGFAEYCLKEDVRQLHAAANAASSDSDAMRLRRKLVKRGKYDPSLKNMAVEDFIVLSPLESELLRRGILEMSYINETNLKVAVMKDTVDAAAGVSCLQMLDWNTVLSKVRRNPRQAVNTGKSGSKSTGTRSSQHSKGSRGGDSNASTHGATKGGSTPRYSATTPPANVGVSTPTSNPAVTLPPVPMVYLGKQTWPVVDDENFVRRQKEITERDLTVVSSQLRTLRENIRENVLELNSRLPTMNDRLGYTSKLLDQYESMERWSTLLINFCRGLCDSADSKTPSSSSTPKPQVPVVLGSSTSDARSAAMKAEGITEGAYCNVCFINTGNNLNPIYTCSRCFMSTHRNCYGVNRNAKPGYNNDYICRRCEYERRTMGSQWQTAFRSCSIICWICGRGGGALKRCAVEEWAHMFCLLSLMPETKCNNYIMMEPWSLDGVAQWRSEALCAVCCVAWGYVMRCVDCEVTAHPLCAWLHGFKFIPTSSIGYRSYVKKGNVLMRELHVRIQCNGHDSDRKWQQFVSTRNKRFLNRDTAYYLFENRDKRRKSRALVMEGMASIEAMDLGQLRSDICEQRTAATERRCGVCFGMGALAVCTQCGTHAHYSCYVESDLDASKGRESTVTTSITSFICDVCRNSDQGAQCAICLVDTGLLKRIPIGGPDGDKQRRYMHTICGVCFPEALIAIYRGKPVGGSTNSENGESGACPICHSSEGLMVSCCKEGCKVKFHANCGMENRFVVESHSVDLSEGPQTVAFCQHHSLISRSVGNNLKLLLRIRPYLQLLRELVDDMAAQDTVVRSWYRKRQELLNAECPLGSIIDKPSDTS